MSDDSGVLPPAPVEPWAPPGEAPTSPRRKQRWGVVVITVVLGLLLVGGGGLYRQSERENVATARRRRDEAAAQLTSERQRLDAAIARYDSTKASYDKALATARQLASPAAALADKAKIATDLLGSYAALLRDATNAWLADQVSEFNRLANELNARAPQLAAATDDMVNASLQIALSGTSAA
jgi:hypothetical protein